MMDKEDLQIAVGVLCVALGLGWCFHPGVGVAVAGACLVVPFFLPRRRRGDE